MLRESDASYYLREERLGWILGPYEKGAPARFADGVPHEFGKELFAGDLDRLLPHVEAAMKRVPCLEHAGIKTIVNGPISYTPDGSPLIGPAWGVKNLWLNEGHSFGVTAAGGSGWQLAEWIVEGEPGIDMLAVDPRRFGAYAGKRYTVKKNEETYRNVFTIHYPDEEREDARPAKTSAVYAKLDQMGAVWGQRYGWERANWFAPPGVPRKDNWSFRRSNYFEHVGNECRRMRGSVGVIDLTPFTKHEVTGPGAEAWLDSLVANKVPVKQGRIALAHALTKRGGIRSEFTITKLGDEHFYVVSAGAGERYDSDYLHRMLPADRSVRSAQRHDEPRHVRRRRAERAGRAGEAHRHAARQRELPVAHRADDRSRATPPASTRCASTSSASSVGSCISRSSTRTGCSTRSSPPGRDFGIGMVGMRAMESLRIEKSYRMWGSDLTPDYTPFEAGLDRFVRMNKGDFIGKEALARQLAAGVPNRFVTLEVHGVTDADPLGNEPLVRRRHAGRPRHGRELRACASARASRSRT